MEDEVDVDIEGDAFEVAADEGDAGGLDQEQYVHSAWKSNAGVLPWELDSSISPENREAIERMLLEEQYYLTGQKVSNRIWEFDAPIKPKTKRSPAKPAPSASGGATRWSKQEKELFEQGLAQFGRRWTKVAKLVGSRSVLQVKSYARQYFKQKVKAEPKTTALPAGPTVKLPPTQATSSQALTLANTVRIEKLSDEENEEVDITDDLSDDGDCNEPPGVISGQGVSDVCTDGPAEKREDTSPEETVDKLESKTAQSPPQSSSLCDFETSCTAGDNNNDTSRRTSPDRQHLQEDVQADPAENKALSFQSDASPQTCPLEEEGGDCTDFSGEQILDEKLDGDEEEEEEEEEEDDDEEEIKPPEQEIEMDTESITEDEKQAIPEFFEGRPSKTPDRYLKIRNYILDQWMKCKPRYLNKTSVRPGLKNCGDVNCIGRIHTYLELVGAINFNCEQAVYNRPKVVDRSKHKEGKDVLEAYLLAQRLQSMRARKRRVRDTWGNWCDAKDLEGQTYEHLSAEELAKRREEMKKQPKPNKAARFKGSLDPFQLIPCRSFGEDVQEPFQVIVCAETLIIMDMHAHVSRGEVIGLLGGTFDEESKVLKICAAEPCNSVSTGMQCEMDPVSQTQACDVLSSLGYSVVGWYHSHPSFHPNPSVRDINTQDQLQSYFSRGGAPFIGMIVSPYDPANRSPHSQTTCLLVRGSQETPGSQKLPYRFDFLSSQDTPDWEQTLRRAQWIIHKYSQSPGSVQMNKFFRKDSHLTCLEKMMSSLAKYLESLPDEDGEPFLNQIQALFLTDFIAKQQASNQEEGEFLNNSPRLADSEGLAFDNVTSDEGTLEGYKNFDSELGKGFDNISDPTDNRSEGNDPMVLHMGSVLSSEHDYLL